MCHDGDVSIMVCGSPEYGARTTRSVVLSPHRIERQASSRTAMAAGQQRRWQSGARQLGARVALQWRTHLELTDAGGKPNNLVT